MRAAHQQMKEELGLDHFEGRSWQGIHRHALMTMIAYAFLQHCRLAATARKKSDGSPPQPTLPAVRQGPLAILHLLGMFVADLFKGRCRFEAENLFLRVGPTVVCAENFGHIDLVRESLTVGHDGRGATLRGC